MKVIGLDKGIFNVSNLEDAAEKSLMMCVEIIEDDTRMLLVNHGTIYTGALFDSISIEERGKLEKAVVASTEYAEDIETGKEPLEFVSFYEDGILTKLGEWAIDKMGAKIIEGNTERLLMPNGKRLKGLNVNKAHPYMLDLQAETAFKYALDRHLFDEAFMTSFIQSLNE